jgi:exonuclease VII small subunit
MTLTATEETRLQNAEKTIQQLKTLIDGAGSKNQLKQLLTLCNEQLRRVEVRLDKIETETNTILDLARKLQ